MIVRARHARPWWRSPYAVLLAFALGGFYGAAIVAYLLASNPGGMVR